MLRFNQLKEIKRNISIAHEHVRKLNLDLKGLTVVTECASKAYGFTPFMAALAGANVIAVGRDSRYGSFEENKKGIETLCAEAGSQGSITYVEGEINDETLSKGDIYTNSGFLRPFSEAKIAKMKSTAMICLMWETWEVRDGEVDIASCQKYGIPLVGTNENFEDANMFCYPGMLALKLLFEMGAEIGNNQIVLLGGGLTGRLIHKTFQDLGLSVNWYVSEDHIEEGAQPYSSLKEVLDFPRLDVVLCADHVSKMNIISEGSYLTFEELYNAHPYSKYGHICGGINVEELKNSDIEFYPPKINSIGYMSYETVELGWEPVILLNCAGLKVGEIVGKNRLNGVSLEDSIRAAVDYGIGMDFKGGFMNYGRN